MRLLLIEDSERLQRSLGEGLRRKGFAVDAAVDGIDGLWLEASSQREADRRSDWPRLRADRVRGPA